MVLVHSCPSSFVTYTISVRLIDGQRTIWCCVLILGPNIQKNVVHNQHLPFGNDKSQKRSAEAPQSLTNLVAASSWNHVCVCVCVSHFPQNLTKNIQWTWSRNPSCWWYFNQPYEIRGCQHNNKTQRQSLNSEKTWKHITDSSWPTPVFRGKTWRPCLDKTGIMQWFNVYMSKHISRYFWIEFFLPNKLSRRQIPLLEDKNCDDIQISLIVVEILSTPGWVQPIERVGVHFPPTEVNWCMISAQSTISNGKKNMCNLMSCHINLKISWL